MVANIYRTLLQSSVVGKPIENANYADICFYDKETDNKVIVDANEFTAEAYPLSRFTPIGVVAVPSSHTDEKRPRIVSLKHMDINHPNEGNVINYIDICFGGRGSEVTNLQVKNEFPYLQEMSNNSAILYI